MTDFDTIRIESSIPKLKLGMLHLMPRSITDNDPVLFIHGASFPSALAAGFRMNGLSWMDHLVQNGYEVFALDFIGYGFSDRYRQMFLASDKGDPLGNATQIYLDIDKAIEYIKKATGKEKINLVAHSWGGSVAALYASKFQNKIAKLVLFATITQRYTNRPSAKLDNCYISMSPEDRVQSMKELTPDNFSCALDSSILHTWGDVWLSSDPIAMQSNSRSIRFPSGFLQDVDDLEHDKPYYEPSEIRVPTLVIRGEWDTYPNGAESDRLFANLTNCPHKKYVVIEKSTHVAHLEKNRFQLYSEVLSFLQPHHVGPLKVQRPIAVIFEVIPASGKKQEYLDIAAQLRPELEKIKGFISIERFQSIYHPEKILSLSFWADEEAVKQWRNLESHKTAQSAGRAQLFKDYQIRVAYIQRDYGMFDRAEAPE